MNRRRLIILLILSISSLGISRAQSLGTLGLDFWTTFFHNASYPLSSQVCEGVMISAIRNCTATISIPGSGWSQSMPLSANTVTSIQVPSSLCYPTTSSITPHNLSVHVTATDSVSIVSYSHADHSLDGASLLPTHSLGCEYMVITGSPRQHPSNYPIPSFFCVIAAEDSTHLTIHPSVAVDLGNSNQTSTPFSVDLNQGQVLYIKSVDHTSDLGDLTGTRIIADDCKRIAVINGNQMLVIPSSCNSGDIVFEQAYPTNTWGHDFVVTRTLNLCADFVKVVALYDDDSIFLDGVLSNVLNTGESIQYPLYPNASFIHTSKPSGVCMFIPSSTYCSSSTFSDPAMTWIPPIEQSVNQSAFCTLTPATTLPGLCATHSVNIIVRQQDEASVFLDGQQLSGFTSLAGSNYKYLRQPLINGRHHLSAGGQGFVAHAIGLGVRVSYSYLVGSQFAEIGRTIQGPSSACISQLNTFSINLGPDETVIWHFGDDSTSSSNPAFHAYNTSGHFSVVASIFSPQSCTPQYDLSFSIIIHDIDTISYYHNVECGHIFTHDSTFLTIYSDTTIAVPGVSATGCPNLTLHHFSVTYNQTFDTASFCEDKFFFWNGYNYNEPGDYSSSHSDQGCTVHDHLHLTTIPAPTICIDTSVCEGQYVYFNNQAYASGSHSATYHAANGCDSIVTLTINTRHRHLIDIYDTLWESSYQIGEHTLYSAGDYEYHYTNSEGCDSIIFLHLWAEPCRLWVPNTFTPGKETNNRFFISGCGLLQADIYIYNRGGDYVAHFDGLTSSWDGTHHGTLCKPDTYVYRIAYRCTDDTHLEHVKVGAVTLLR